MKVSIVARFLAKVKPTETCWLWTGSISAKGYGTINIRGKPEYAHRVSYWLFIGPTQKGFVTDHLCRVRHCVRPDHLESVLPIVNSRRGVSAMKTHCVNGHEFSIDNTYVSHDGHRRCKICVRQTNNEIAKERWWRNV